jgi:hypothetical protein
LKQEPTTFSTEEAAEKRGSPAGEIINAGLFIEGTYSRIDS